MNGDFSPFGRDLLGDPISPQGLSPLATRFIFPPFSVLDARNGDWQARKDAWLSLGLKSEVGRAGNLLGMSATVLAGGFDRNGESKARAGAEDEGEEGGANGGTSVFDPVLCELAYKWWAPPAGRVLDPFAGGSVRGVVAQKLGLSYWGSELRQEQVDANRAQAAALCAEPLPEWVCGDSRETLADAMPADFVFTCPPYGDLERYSDDPRDISTLPYHHFIEAFSAIMRLAVARLRPNRFACVVVGDFRDKRNGHYRGFVADTIALFKAAGLPLYNHGILLTPVGSVPMRMSGQFDKSRKLGKIHQDVLVFVKGDPTIWTKAKAE